jgi:hypothetical protein
MGFLFGKGRLSTKDAGAAPHRATRGVLGKVKPLNNSYKKGKTDTCACVCVSVCVVIHFDLDWYAYVDA